MRQPSSGPAREPEPARQIRFPQAVRERLHLGREQVPVGVEGDAGRRMAQLRLHRLDARTLGDEQAGAGMPKVVEPQAVRQWGQVTTSSPSAPRRAPPQNQQLGCISGSLQVGDRVSAPRLPRAPGRPCQRRER